MPYFGYVEANLRIPQISKFNEDMLIWLFQMISMGNVSCTTRALTLITKEESQKASDTWINVHLCVAVSGASKV